MPAKKASTTQLKLVSPVMQVSAQDELLAPEPMQSVAIRAGSEAEKAHTPFERAFQAALRAERRIGDVLEAEWKAAGDDAQEQLRLSAFALMAHDDPYADLFDAKPWVERLSGAIAACESRFAENDVLAFWRDAGILASQQSSGRATQEIFDACIERVRKGVAPGANEWLYLAILCVVEANSRQQSATTCAVIEIVSSHRSFKSATSNLIAYWYYISGYGYFLAHSLEEAKAAWHASDLLSADLGVEVESNAIDSQRTMDSLRVRIRVAYARIAVDNNDLLVAQKELDPVKSIVVSCVADARLLYHHMVSRVALRSGHLLEAQHHLDTAREVLRLEYRDPGFSTVVLTEYLQVLFAQERWGEAVRTADEFKPHFERHGLHYGEFLRLAALTRMWAEEQGPDCEAPFLISLKAAMDLAVKHDFRALLRSVPVFASWLCARALEHGIHSEFAREVVVSRKLPTPIRAPRQWPWAVWLDLIGPFAITLDGQRLMLGGKVAQKPLELIKLLACTKRYTLSLESAAMQLWPEAEELSAARKNLEMTIARARKLIGDSVIKVGEGRVQLDAEQVGCDLQYVLDTCTEAESLAQRNEKLSKLARAAGQLSELSDGELLQADEESLWLGSARQYLRSAFVRATLALASALQGHDMQTDEVTSLLENAISREPLAEQLYTKLMQHYADQGRKAEALHTYRRCKQNLSVISGISPCKATEFLKEQLMNT